MTQEQREAALKLVPKLYEAALINKELPITKRALREAAMLLEQLSSAPACACQQD